MSKVVVRASLETSVAIGDLKLGGDTNLEHELSSPESFLGVELECWPGRWGFPESRPKAGELQQKKKENFIGWSPALKNVGWSQS